MNGPANELELDVKLRRVLLRDFDYRLGPRMAEPELVAPGVYRNPGAGVDGLELLVRARDTGLEIVLRFERGEFVNVATAGLAMLDLADAAEENGRG